ncbi:hypothetical protein [Kitasatospora sp. NPDC094011]
MIATSGAVYRLFGTTWVAAVSLGDHVEVVLQVQQRHQGAPDHP